MADAKAVATAARGTARLRRFSLASASLVVAVATLVPAGAVRAVAVDDVPLLIYVGGTGAVTLTSGSRTDTCSSATTRAGEACNLSPYARGSTVTMSAGPAGSFAGWSLVECEGKTRARSSSTRRPRSSRRSARFTSASRSQAPAR